MTRNLYQRLGLVLVVSGATLAPVFYFVVGSVPPAALALSAIILGPVSAILASRSGYNPGGRLNDAADRGGKPGRVTGEAGANIQSGYLPSSEGSGIPRAPIPLNKNGILPGMGQTPLSRLTARYGLNLTDMSLVMTTPGLVRLDTPDGYFGNGLMGRHDHA